MAAEKRKIYEGDFETTTDPEDVRVWASCLVDVESIETSFIGNDIDSFFDFLKDKNSVVYFHNLKFDGEFILSYLLSHGYQYSQTRESKTFDTLITDDGLFYSITVYFEKLNKKYKKVVIYDSLKKLPFKVSVIAKAFELADQKGSIDYKAHRERGHVLTEEEKEYIIKDCRIVAQALKIQFSKGLVKMTNASDAMSNYKEIIGKATFEKWFPVLPFELDADIRQAYKGGFTYLNPRFRNKRVNSGVVLDVNSLYPWVMYTKLLPYGYPMYFEGEYQQDDKYPLFICRMRCSFKLKPGHIPTLQLKNNRSFVETEYLTTSNGEIVDMTLTSVDLQLLKDHYILKNEEYDCGWKFKAAHGMFQDYIDYWMHIKETTTGAMRQLAKLMLNSLYGKFATNPKAYQKACYLDADGVVRYEVIKDEKTAKKYGVKPPELRDPVYTAMGCFITAYAREKTIRSAQSVYDRFIYADTDSLHLTGDVLPEGLEVHPTHLGAWKHEGTFCDSLYIRAKTYMETMVENKAASLKVYCSAMGKADDISVVWLNGDVVTWHETKVTCAGMPDNVKELVTYENFHSGSTFEGKLMPRRYKGGIVLMETTFTIK